MSEILRFQFTEPGDFEGVDGDACLAIFAAECVHGRPKTRLEVSYLVDAGGRRCVLKVNGPAGETAAQVFTGLCNERFGEAGFTVERVQQGAWDTGKGER